MNKRMNKKGFTLIELLATILVLAIIMMIAYPKIRKVIDESKRSAFLTTAKSVLKATDNFYGLKTSINDFTPGLVYDLVGGDTIKFTGGDFKTGEVMVDENGNTALALWDGAYCIVKDFDDENDELTIVKNKTGENCDVSNVNAIIHYGTTGYLCADPGSTVVTEEKYFTFNQGTKTITGYSDLGPKNIVIPCTIGGVNVENIGSFAFSSKNLISVVMPDTLLNIGTYAFYYNLLTSVSLGNSLVNLDKGCFYENRLTEIVLPDSLKTIATGGMYTTDNAFGKNRLTKVVFGSGIETIGAYSFTSTYASGGYGYSDANPITEVDFSRAAKLKTIADGAFYYTDIISVDLSASPLLTTIGSNSFAQNNITFLNIAGANLSIANAAFTGNKIAEFTLNATSTTIGNSAFANNLISSLSLTGKITSIGDDAFKNNQMPDDKAYIYGRNVDGTTNTTLVSYAGASRSNLRIPDSIKSMTNATFTSLGLNGTLNTGNGLTFIESSKFQSNSLTGVTVGSGVTSIGTYAFYSNAIVNLSIGNNVTSIGTYAFAYNQISNLTLGTGLTSLDKGVFYSNKLTTVTIPDNIKTIVNGNMYTTDNVFGLNRLTKVILGSGIETIGTYAFTSTYASGGYGYSDANPITEVDFSRAVNLKVIGDGAFSSGDIVSLDLSENVLLNTIGNSAFANNNITELNLNGATLNIVSGSFTGNKIVDLTINGSNVTIGANAFANNLISNLSLIGNITSIGNDAFKNNQLPDAQAFVYGRNADGSTNTTLVSYGGARRSNVVIPDTLTSLTNASFTSLGLAGTLNTGNGLTYIESSKFQSNLLTGVTIGSAVNNIGTYAFYANSITTLDIVDNVTSIGIAAFAYNQISNLTFGTGLTSLDKGIFYSNKLTTVTIPDNIKTIVNGNMYTTDNVFGLNRLTKVVLGSGIETIGAYSFTSTYASGGYGYSDANPITEVDFSRAVNLKTIGDGAFSSGDIINLDLSDNVLLNTIGSSAFANNNITSLNLNGATLNIVSGSFTGNKIVDLTVNGANVTIGANAFANNLISNLNLIGNITSIGSDAFKNNQLPDAQAFIYGRNGDGSTNSTLVSYAGAKRTNVIIPDSITSLTSASFTSLGLSGILDTGNGLTSIESSKFQSNALTGINIGSSVTSIGSYAFYGNVITSLNIGNNVNSMGTYAFAYNQISSLTLGNGITLLDKGTFYSNRLTTVTISDSVRTIAVGGMYTTDNVFGLNRLTKVELGSGLETIGAYAFTSTYASGGYGYSDANPITEVDTSRASSLKTIGDGAFSYNKFTTFEVPAGVLTIGTYALSNNSSLSKILVKGKVDATNFTSLGSSWNGNCNNIIYEFESCYVYSGNTITNYEIACSKKVELPTTLGGNTITTIAANAFANKGLYNIVIPNTVMNIGDNAFNGNTMEAIGVSGKTSAANFTSLGTNWTGGNPIAYSGNNNSCFVINSGVVTKYYDVGVCSKNMVIPNGTTEIGAGAFVNDNLNSVTIPSSLNTIGNDPFTGNLLSSMTVNDGTNFTSLGTNWKINLLKVNFQGTAVEYNCFTTSGNSITKYHSYCPETVAIPASVEGTSITSLTDNSFKGSAVRYITIPSTITSIGNNAFEGNDIVTLSLIDGLTTIGSNAFNDTGLLTLTLPSTLENIGASAFANNSGLTEININGKTSPADFTSLGTSWNGTCSNIRYLGN